MVSGELKWAKPDLCISEDDIILVVQESKPVTHPGFESAEAQLVAEAIAAFRHNNNVRVALGMEPLMNEVRVKVDVRNQI